MSNGWKNITRLYLRNFSHWSNNSQGQMSNNNGNNKNNNKEKLNVKNKQNNERRNAERRMKDDVA